MSCIECKMDYVMDKLNVNEECVRRMTNRIDCSPNSAEVADVKRMNAYAFREFEERWKGGRECTHVQGLDQSDKSRVQAPGYVPEQTAKQQIDEPVGNIGVDALASRASATHSVGGRHGGGRSRGRK